MTPIEVGTGLVAVISIIANIFNLFGKKKAEAKGIRLLMVTETLVDAIKQYSEFKKKNPEKKAELKPIIKHLAKLNQVKDTLDYIVKTHNNPPSIPAKKK